MPHSRERRSLKRGRQTGQADAPDEWWKYIAGFFALPIKYDADPPTRPPWATWGLAIVITVVSAVAFLRLDQAVAAFGLIPAQASRYGGLTLLTAFFLHGSVFHLAGNLYFLLIFGDNVEDCLGRGMYLLLIALATITGNWLHVVVDPHHQAPLIGASGGISGIVAFYAMRFPKIQLLFMLRAWFWFFRWFKVRVYVFFILWIVFQVLGAYSQIAGTSHVSALAHLGGAAVGFLFYAGKRFAEAPV